MLKFLVKILNFVRETSGLAEPPLQVCEKCGNVDFGYNFKWNFVDKYSCYEHNS